MPLIGIQYSVDDDAPASELPDEAFGRMPAAPRMPRRERVTLDPTRTIPGGVAKRLQRIYQGVDLEQAAAGRHPAIEQATQALGRNGNGKLDSRAAMADCAALHDHLAAHPELDPLEAESPDVVPWSYVSYRGRPQLDGPELDGITRTEFNALPETYYVGGAVGWGRKCACGARETGMPHDWHDRACPRYRPAARSAA